MELNMNYFNSLVTLTCECARNGIVISKVTQLWNGFKVKFEGFPYADAILHDGSYGHMDGLWESIGFPWDEDDVSTHTPSELAYLIGQLKRNAG